MTGFCGVLGTRLIQARPYDPETKGVVERANQYLDTSFLPGRTFASAADFNTQLMHWLTGKANQRRHAGNAPLDQTQTEEGGPRWLSCRRWPQSSARR